MTARVVRVGELLSTRVRSRSLAVVGTLVVLALVVAVIALGLGEIQVSAVDVVRALVSDAQPVVETLVVQWRLPRVLLAVMFGIGLGLAGATFQSLTRNPLGSPDVIGFDAGAYTAAVTSIVLVGGTALVVPASVGGGVVTALLVYLLAYRRGVQGFRLIVVGIAITAMLGAFNAYLLLKAELWQAQVAAIWGAGSLNGLSWHEVRVVALVYAVALVPTVLLARPLRTLELGDDAAAALGVRVERSRVALLIVGIVWSATVTAYAGPITFVALAAPQMARRLTRAPGVQLVPAAAMGAVIVLSCDLIALNALPAVVPVGLITLIGGGAYLVWLLLVQSRKEIR